MSIADYAISVNYGFGVLFRTADDRYIFSTSLTVKAVSAKTSVTERKITGYMETANMKKKEEQFSRPLFLVLDDTDMQWKEYFSGMPVNCVQINPAYDFPQVRTDDDSYALAFDVDKRAVILGDTACPLFTGLTALPQRCTATKFSEELSLYSNPDTVKQFVTDLSNMQSAANAWTNDLNNAIKEVTEERQRKENQADATERSIAAGFGQYAGYDPDRERAEKEAALNAELESIDRLINAGQWPDAGSRLIDSLSLNPTSTEVMTRLGYVEFMDNFSQQFYDSYREIYLGTRPYENKPEALRKDMLLKFGRKETAWIYQEKKQTEVTSSDLYHNYKNSVCRALDKVSRDTDGFLKELEDNFFLLTGFRKDDGCICAFFIHNHNVMYRHGDAYYRVDSVHENRVIMTFDSFREWPYPQRLCVNLGLKIEYILENHDEIRMLTHDREARTIRV